MTDSNVTLRDAVGTTGGVRFRLEAQEKDLGEFVVRRALPAPQCRMVGPFIFFDHMGPAEFGPGKGIQVRPHPHIGIATITYLFEGEIMHRDSLGFVQPIRPGAVNLMTAGKGIAHSERAGQDLETTSRLHGIQSWMALPDGQEEMEPAFRHFPANELPQLDVNGVIVRIIMGEAYGQQSPVTEYCPILYLECQLPKGSELALPDEYEELGAYVVSGNVSIDDEAFSTGVLAVGEAGASMTLRALEDTRVMIIGGAHLGERHIWWNFVSSSKQRIERAKQDWQEGRFESVPDDDEFIPLPE